MAVSAIRQMASHNLDCPSNDIFKSISHPYNMKRIVVDIVKRPSECWKFLSTGISGPFHDPCYFVGLYYVENEVNPVALPI